jgi:hypothetical protein
MPTAGGDLTSDRSDDDGAEASGSSDATREPSPELISRCGERRQHVHGTPDATRAHTARCAAIAAGFAKVAAAAPDEIAAALGTAMAEFEANGGSSAEFGTAMGQIYRFIQSNCGFADLTMTATEYAFGGLPLQVDAGPVVVSLANTGTEVHEVVIARVADGVTETVEQLLALPEDELANKVTVVASAIAMPGHTGYAAADLTPGRYIAACPLPQHNTPEMIEHMFGSDSDLPEDAGPPHFIAGMRQDFEVT